MRQPHIDGLRAIAILSVVGFHAAIPGFAGGFAGVDIFFVISGFLIIGQIIDDVQAGTFSFSRFYSRRVLRILPPLLLVVGAVVAVAIVMPMIPRDIERIRLSAMASAAMVANWYFMNQDGYFALPSATEPLLHMWSLGVEEQFYLVAPMTLVGLAAVARLVRKPAASVWLAAIVLGFTGSLLVALLSNPQFAFYATPSRAWELLAGGFAALLVRRNFSLTEAAARAGCIAGLTLVIAGVVVIGFRGGHQTALLLVPALGTAIVLVTGTFHSEGAALRLLSLAPLVGIGLVSYSWYLWHWPIGVLWRATQLDPLSTGQKIVLVVILPFLLSVATYFGVERPLRAWRHKPWIAIRPRTIVAAGLTASLALALSAHALSSWSAYLAREGRMHPFVEAQHRPWDSCPFGVSDAELLRCLIGGSPAPRAIVWGDSHAGSLFGAVEAAAAQTRASAYLRWTPGCPPLMAAIVTGGRQSDTCLRDNTRVLDWLRSPLAHDITGVVLASRWANAGELYEIPRTLHGALEDTLAELNKLERRALVVGPVPEFKYRVPECVFLASNYSRDAGRCVASRAELIVQHRGMLQQLIHAARPFPNVRVIDPLQAFCDETSCRPELNGEILFGDTHHLSRAGGRVLYERFRDDFAWVLGATK